MNKTPAELRQDAEDIGRFAMFAWHERLSSSELLQATELLKNEGVELSATIIRVARLMDEQAKKGCAMGCRELCISLSSTAVMCEQTAAALESGQPQPTPEESI